MSHCRMCPLSLDCQVAGRGLSTAKLIVIGNNPTNEDEKTGVPFSGGKDPNREYPNMIIRRVLSGMKYDLEKEVYFAYALRCSPEHRADKIKVTHKHLNACRVANLDPELSKVPTPVIVTMGARALAQVLPDLSGGVPHNRGRWFEAVVGGRKRLVMPTYAPGDINRMSIWKVKETKPGKFERVKRWNPPGTYGAFFLEDVQTLREKLNELGLGPDALRKD